jgi:hypothetical protein
VIIGPSYLGSADELALSFLKDIADERFKNFQKVTGAYQGKGRYNLNQLRDAFLLWCAEHNGADYLLTLDFKLINMVKRDKKHNITFAPVLPSELLDIISPSVRLTRSTGRKKGCFLFPPFSRPRLP